MSIRIKISAYIATVFAVACLLCPPAYGQKAQQDKKARLEREIALLDKQISDNTSKSRDALGKLEMINQKMEMRGELIKESEAEIASMTRNINAKQRQLNELQDQLDTLSAYYTRLIRSAYKNRDAKIWYMHILASENLGQAFRRYAYFRNLSEQMKIQADKIRGLQVEVEKQKSELQALRADEQEERKKLKGELNKLNLEKKEADKVIDDLKKNRKRYEKEIDQKKKQVKALNKEIERLIAQAMKGGKTSSGKAAKPIDYTLAAEFSKNKGKLPWPAEGPVVEHYGVRYHPVYTRLKLPSNDGINIALEKGTQVKAVFDGEVRQIVVMPGYNQCILVQHGNYFSFYCKLGDSIVKAGDKVKTGDILGTVDTMNGETVLHFQVWENQKTQDPEKWLRPR